MKEIDIENWKRKGPYETFKDYSHPQFSIGARLDVTNLVKYCKDNKKSFFATFLYIVSKSANKVEEMKIRIIDDKIVEYDIVHPSYVVLRDDNVITTCKTDYVDSFDEFYKNCRNDVDRTKKNKDVIFDSSNDNGVLYISCLPFTDVYTVTNPYDIKNKNQTSIPRIVWGKFVEENGRYKMGFFVECHHALVDGEPVCKFINYVIEEIEKFNK